MPTTTNKQRLLNDLFTVLKKSYDAAEPESRPVLEQFLYGICRENATREQADRVFRNLQERFFDWNEVRVSSLRELEEALQGLPEPEVRAQRITSFLQKVFEENFSFDLEGLHKKGLKLAAKALQRYHPEASDYPVAWVVQQSLGGHAIPLDPATQRVGQRLGLIEGDEDDPEALRASLEHLVPKARGALFSELVSLLAAEVCWEEEPNCAACPLSHECPTGQEHARAEVAAPRASRTKPR